MSDPIIPLADARAPSGVQESAGSAESTFVPEPLNTLKFQPLLVEAVWKVFDPESSSEHLRAGPGIQSRCRQRHERRSLMTLTAPACPAAQAPPHRRGTAHSGSAGVQQRQSGRRSGSRMDARKDVGRTRTTRGNFFSQTIKSRCIKLLNIRFGGPRCADVGPVAAAQQPTFRLGSRVRAVVRHGHRRQQPPSSPISRATTSKSSTTAARRKSPSSTTKNARSPSCVSSTPASASTHRLKESLRRRRTIPAAPSASRQSDPRGIQRQGRIHLGVRPATATA